MKYLWLSSIEDDGEGMNTTVFGGMGGSSARLKDP